MTTPSTATTSQQSFLPDFCSLRAVMTVIVVGELLAIILSLSHVQSNNSELLPILGLLSLFIQWLALSSATILCITRRLIHIKAPLMGGVSYIVLLINTLIFAEMAYQAIEYSGLLQFQFDALEHQPFLLHTLAIAAIIYALLLRYLYMQHQWQLQLHAEAEARYQMLQSRIRPHFLFNTMNTIACLIHDNPDKAERAIEDFSELLRATLQEPKQCITLQQELILCRHYLDIEKLRLGDRLNIEWQLDHSDTVLPPLLIQPLVENAVYHGIEPSIAGGTLALSCKEEGRHVIITIKNPLSKHASTHQGHQLAQNNIRQRLALAYDNKAKIECQESSGNYLVTLTLPITQELQCAL